MIILTATLMGLRILDSYILGNQYADVTFGRGSKMNCRVACSSILATALLFAFSTDHFALAEAKDEGTDKVFVGYVYRRPQKINFGLYTHLCHAFVVADEDGTIRQSRSCPSRELVADAHKAGVRVLISLGGWGWDKQFAAIVSKPEAEDRYVKSVLAIVDEYDYDGIDLDWEYPDTQEEVVGFERLSRRFRKQLDELGQKKGRHLFQTMAASANPPTLKWLTQRTAARDDGLGQRDDLRLCW